VYYDMANAIILLYDVTNAESFQEVQFWHDSIRKLAKGKPKLFLVGNKIDERGKRVISKKLPAQYARQHDLHFAETSVKDPHTIDDLLKKINHYLLDHPVRRRGNKPDVLARVPNTKPCIGCFVV
jgi:GTPase SAR1 family protein